ncbi:MAG: hypothetical protein LUQ59_04940, partial [Methanothrix sp.]|nr:hypothetical protein [Methanothrix sp.]
MAAILARRRPSKLELQPSSHARPLILLAAAFLCVLSGYALADEAVVAPAFTAMGADGENFSLSDFSGAPLILHITNIEIPLCVECEESLKGQVEELARLRAMHPEVQIATLNL